MVSTGWWCGTVEWRALQRLSGFSARRRAGLAKTDEVSRSKYTKAFADLTVEQRFEICKALEAEQRPFFDLVLAHTMQGFYGNPRHGGNREYVSWRMLGVTPTQVRGRNLYELRTQTEAT